MRKFKDILRLATTHHGDEAFVLAAAENDHYRADLKTVPADRLLATMTRCVFNAGFNWRVIAAKWDGFEAAFDGFDPHKLAFFGDEMLDSLVSDARIVRNGQKIKATLENARFVADVEKEHGGFGAYLTNWPADDQFGLMEAMGKRGSRLGGATVQYFLRFSGWDAWITSKDVMAAFVRDGVIDKPATTKTAMRQMQAGFNAYHDESGLPRAQISKVLARSVGP